MEGEAFWSDPLQNSFHDLGLLLRLELVFISHETELLAAYLMGLLGDILMVVLDTNLLDGNESAKLFDSVDTRLLSDL